MNLTSSQAESLTLLGLGILVTILTSLLKTVDFSPKFSNAISGVLSLLTGYVSSYFLENGPVDLIEAAKHSTYIYTAAQLVYIYALQNTAFNAWLVKFNLLPTKK
jgi:Zn-dependent protease